MRMVKGRRGLIALVLPLFGSACVVVACTSRDDGHPPPNVTQTKPKGWVIDVDPVTGTTDLMVAIDPLAPTAVNGKSHEQAAREFIEQHKDAFKLTNPNAQLVLEEVAIARDKTGHVTFAQK